MEYLLHILILIAIYTMLSVSLNLVVGYSGILSVAHAAFYGIGAYVAALMALEVHSPMLVNVLFAAVLGGCAGALVGIPSIRLKGDHLVVATFAFQVITFGVLNNWVSLTRGPMGLPGIPSATLLGLAFSSPLRFLLLASGFCVICLCVVYGVVRSPYGRALRAVREDDVLAQAAGKNAARYKATVFVLAAAMAAIAGAMYAYYVRFVDPTSFTISESIFIVAVVVVGGAGSLWGPVLGAVMMVLVPETLRFVVLPSSVAANVRQVLYGGLLVVLMIWRPRGLIGKYAFREGGR